VVNSGLDSSQRDLINSHFNDVTGEPVWSTGWSYERVSTWLRVLVNAGWESDPSAAPEAWRSRAQNTGVANNSTINGVTNWAADNQLASATDPQRFVYLDAGLNALPTFSLDGVDDGVVSESPINLSPLASIVTVVAP